MNTIVSTMSIQSIVCLLRMEGKAVQFVTPEQFPMEACTLNTVDLSDSIINPKAREVAVILKTQLEKEGYTVKEFILANEIPHPIKVPWEAIAKVLGTLAVAVVLLYGIYIILPYLLVLGAAVMVLGLVDPVLIAVVEDRGKTLVEDQGETLWISCGWWWHSSGK